MSVISSSSDISQPPSPPRPPTDAVPYSSESSSTGNEKSPSVEYDSKHSKEPVASGGKKYVIPKRKRSNSTSSNYAHRSPLNRTFPDSCEPQYKRQKFYNNTRLSNRPFFNKRPNQLHGRYYPCNKAVNGRPVWNRPFRRNTWYRNQSNTKPWKKDRYYKETQPYTRPQNKIKLSDKMWRHDEDKLFDEALLPVPSSRASFTALMSSYDKIQKEKFTDVLVKTLIEWASSEGDLVSKSITRDKVASHYTTLKSFLQNSINRDAWVGVRKEEMASSGLINLVAFMEETACWLQINLENLHENEKPRGDIILACCSFLCRQAVSKLRTLAQCCLDDPEQSEVILRLCRLVVEGRAVDAGLLIQEISLNFKFGILVAMIVAPYIFLHPSLRPDQDPAPIITKFISAYRPGYMMGLLNSVIQQHSNNCQSRSCVGDVKATLISRPSCTGLFFYPLYDKK